MWFVNGFVHGRPLAPCLPVPSGLPLAVRPRVGWVGQRLASTRSSQADADLR